MRTGLMMTALMAAMVLGGLAPQAQARPRPGAHLTLTGYRVLVEPEIVEDFQGRLITRALRWKLRAVYTTPRGYEVLARPRSGRRGKAPLRDATVRVDRPWERTDFPRESRLFRKFRKAKRRFRGLSRSPEITLLERSYGEDMEPRPLVRPAHERASVSVGGSSLRVDGADIQIEVSGVSDEGDLYVEPPPRPAPMPPAPTCEQVLLAQGHHASLLDNCRGVDQRCAVALLRKGHHPSLLDNCRGVDPRCAEQVLEAGFHPSLLDNCSPGLSPGCVSALIAAGHHPSLLDNCRGVDGLCAETLLSRGDHPSQLDNCRRR